MSSHTDAVGFYVAQPTNPSSVPALGPLPAPQDADRCVPAVRARLRALGVGRDDPLAVICLTAHSAQQLPDGWLNPYFPRGLLDPDRLPAEAVHYWVAADAAVLRWVATTPAAPEVLLGRGQAELPDTQASFERVRDVVANHDPLLARSVTAWVQVPPRDTDRDGRLRTVRLRANRLDVGALLVAAGPDRPRVRPVVFVRHLRDSRDLYRNVHYRFSLTGRFEVCPEHELVDVLDASPPLEQPASPASADAAARPSSWAAPTPTSRPRRRAPSAGQQTLFDP